MEKILFLTDFSEVADNAFIYALSVAEKINAEIHILHIVHIIEAKDTDEQMRVHPLATFYNKQLETDEWSGFKTEAKKLEKIAQDNHKMNVPVEFHFEKGYFQEVVDDYIEELDIDVVVMGTWGANTVDKKLFGSHTGNLINHLEIPLFAIPEQTVFSEVRNFTLAVTLNENEYKIVNRLAGRLQKAGGDHLKCVYVAENQKEALKAEAKKEMWKSNINSAEISLEIIINSDVIDGLNDFMSSNSTDVLCVIHRHKSFLQRLLITNYTKHLLQYSKTALLIYNNE
ncbi:Nucleotide-binding universal stress protein, UspA family [Chryseobacterium taichungense]|uniref:Nucleotide-binding universal stress protein, UspA family n=1 Tax=Chryseobacterium taichungense TaxID=295069 RepID=A0A1H7YHL4_9FLAO|nr:universal stress protein [Chryseobacterium taichungense]SEM45736.1 Nucleotide-binding universal stress protein, UspA family [Chryseobacterium taichungense]